MALHTRFAILAFLYSLIPITLGQFIQDYQWVNGRPQWRRDTTLQLEDVLIPQNMVILEYNCDYMPAICQNAQNWLNGPRGANRALMTNRITGVVIPPNSELFSYDFGPHSDSRGARMCPGNWRNNHPCPEPNQPPIMPGPWYSTARENVRALQANEIRADRRTPGREIRSGRYYTCDEFPPRSFVEGGNGTPNQNVMPEGDGGRGTTYCAPQRLACTPRQVFQPYVRSEQDWQASAHTKLRGKLWTESKKANGGITTGFENRAALFAFRLANRGTTNGRYARVLWGPNQGKIIPVVHKRDGQEDMDFDDEGWSSVDLHVNGTESVTRARKRKADPSSSSLPLSRRCDPSNSTCDVTPSCNGDSAANRRLAYYQGHNSVNRNCNPVKPGAINTTGLTHLIFSHVDFDNSTFQVTPGSDTSLLRNFTSLARNNLQTWIAINGDDTAWSTMASAEGNRKKFIQSLDDFIKKYGFQGVDLMWENPGDKSQGGRSQDGENFAALVREINSTFDGRYGLSVTLPSDPDTLGKFQLREMDPYLTFFGFKAFDLHGPWECNKDGVGIQPHTDVTTLDKDMRPLWVAGVSPKKVNLGVASYGRSYKLRNESCTTPGCACSGPGDAGHCTADKGVLSSWEIQDMISDKKYEPQFNQTAMVKYLTYGDNSWVSYDDKETLDLKDKFASSRCIGGLIDSSIDLQPQDGTGAFGGVPSSNNTNNTDSIWVSPAIWNNTHPEVVCSYPCTLVLPPWTKTTSTIDYPVVTYTSSSLTTTVTPPPLTVSVWWISTIIVGEDITTPPSSGESVTANVTMFQTTAWPPITITDDDGKEHTTQAAGAPPVIPPGAIPVPPIVVPFGLPPGPTAAVPFPTPCIAAFGLCSPGDTGDGGDGGDEGENNCPDLQCDPSSDDGDGDDGGGDGDDGDGDDDGDDGDEDGDVCSYVPPISSTLSTSSTSSTTSSSSSTTTTSLSSSSTTSHSSTRSRTTTSSSSRTTSRSTSSRSTSSRSRTTSSRSSRTTSSRTSHSRTTTSHTSSRSTSTRSRTTSHTTTTSAAASTPTSCSGSKFPAALIYAWSDYKNNKFSFRGIDYCASSSSKPYPDSACDADWAWTQNLPNSDSQSQIASDLKDISVFGDTCNFKKDDGGPGSSGRYTGKLKCGKWKTASCTSSDTNNHEEHPCDSDQKVWWNFEWSCVWGS
ncbi:glycosyl hydrolases family 18-domain-containing protein [Hypoxylon trugodes]|uniref:glycosyl hydrolases family 18-domain-containing protein n=1 Tax=Hypoxylon trugodes TaxID=326681 RepID=UPI00219AFF03|nr:glycosyl hydrolases family 18-domain-containing protein [Hypoxylon trugodes]KAI1392048.1 glycosyl hydrolases family 18-domain-containing protein [Hypoxylon trugodes]